MKKRILSILLTICMVVTIVPSYPAIESDAGVVGSVLSNIVSNAGTIINASMKTAQQAKDAAASGKTWNFGESLLAASKNMAMGFLGIDDGSSQDNYIIQQVDLSGVEKNLGDIQKKLTSQQMTLNDLQKQIADNTNDLSKQINYLKETVENTGNLGRKYIYLTDYFSFYNNFYNALMTNEKRINNLYKNSPTQNTVKSAYDRLYLLDGYGSTNFYATLELMTQYLCGENYSLENGTIIDVLYEYYELANYSPDEITNAIKEFAANTYYTYCLANYYYMSTALYQKAYMEDNHLEEYKIDGTAITLSSGMIEDETLDIIENGVKTAGKLFSDLNKRYCTLDNLEVGYEGPIGLLPRSINEAKMDVEPGSKVYLPDASTIVDKCFGEGYSDMFGNLCQYYYDTSSTGVTQNGTALVFDKSLSEGDITVNLCSNVGDQKVTIQTFTFTVKKGKLAGGYGTGEYPYFIENYDQFETFANSGASFSNACVSLLADIDCTDKAFEHISYPFSGIFYGNGYTISNINKPESCLYGSTNGSTNGGFFDCLNGGKIYDLTLEKCYFRFLDPDIVGGFAGKMVNGSRIERCQLLSSVIVGQNYDEVKDKYVGGIAGKVEDSYISKCIVKDSQVSDNGYNDYIGTIAGYVTSALRSNPSIIEYSGRENSRIDWSHGNAIAGGLIGYLGNSEVKNCWNYMTGYADYVHQKTYGTFFGSCYNYGITNCVLYTGDDANTVNTGTVTIGNDQGGYSNFLKVSDFTKNNIGLGDISCFANDTSTITFADINRSIDSSNAKKTYIYGEPLNLCGLRAKLARGGETINGGQLITVETKYNPDEEGSYDVNLTFKDFSDKYTVTVARAPHTYEQKIVNATCGTDGVVKYVCKDCNSEIEGYTIPATGHKMTYIPGVNATCEKEGRREYWKCSECEKYFVDEKGENEITEEDLVIPLGSHDMEHHEAVEATCKEGNIEYWYCKICKKYFSDEDGNNLTSKENVLTSPKFDHEKEDLLMQASLYQDGKYVTRCKKCGEEFSVKEIEKIGQIKLSSSDFTYSGATITPVVTVLSRSGNIIGAENYSVSYSSGRKKIGHYSVVVTFKGNYAGSETLTFNINPKGTKLSNVKAGKKKVTVKWKKQTKYTKGYQIQYSTNKRFTSNVKTKTVVGKKKTSVTLKKLKSKKTYYVRIRTYQKATGGNCYSAWSGEKKVKVK